MLNRPFGFGLLLVFGAASLALHAQSPDEKVQQDEKIRTGAEDRRFGAAHPGRRKQKENAGRAAADESKKQTQDEAAVDLSKSAATVSADTSGFKIQSGDGDFC